VFPTRSVPRCCKQDKSRDSQHSADSVQWILGVGHGKKISEGKTQASYFSRRLRVSEDMLQLNGPNIPFVNNVSALDVTFDRRIAWRHHIGRTVTKASQTYVRTSSLFRSGRLCTSIKLTPYKALRSVMTYACPSWEYATDAHILKLQRLQNRVLRAIRNLDTCTPVRNCTWLSKFLTYMTKKLKYAGHRQK
jgi:hypothetical protein